MLEPQKPSQVKFIRPAQMALFARLISYPPLEQITIIPPTRKEIHFTVLLESSQTLPQLPWEVSIWYDSPSWKNSKGSWQALELKRKASTPIVFGPEGSMSKVFRHTFTGMLPSPYTETNRTYKGRRVPFTVRYRTDPSSNWQWVNTLFGTRDGEIILQPPLDPNHLGSSPIELEPGWVVRKLTSEAPDARLYGIESTRPIPVKDRQNATIETKLLGRVTLTSRFFALVRIWTPWLAPRHGGSDFGITEDAVMCSFLRKDGLHVVILAVNGVDDVLTLFKSTDDGDIVVSARNDTGNDVKFRILVASAWNFEVANAAVMYEARRQIRSSSAYQVAASMLSTHIDAESVDSDTILVSTEQNSEGESAPTPLWLESWYDSLAYCTWNSLGQDLNADKIMAGLDSLAKKGIHVATLIIDDNWQSLDGVQGDTPQWQRGWKSFEANSEGFPGGLKGLTTIIREKYPAIKDIAVWHALLGYWGGISPDGEIAKKYRTIEVEKAPGLAGGTMLAVHPDDVHQMYDDFYSFLSESGVTAVKTDAQFFLDLLDRTTDRKLFTMTYQSAWTQAHLKHLSGKAISCMSQIPQILFHSFLPTNTPRVMLRNSDDFFPDIPASHPWHVFCNAYNALMVQHLNVLPDWDMFQTSHPYSGFHAAARCVSGGPIYITDTPGEHDVDLIHQMTALNPRGQTVVLRPSNVGRSINIYDNYNEGHVLKVGVYDGRSQVGTSIMGVFNVSDREISFMLPITDFPCIESQESGRASRSWVVRSHMSKKIIGPIEPLQPLQPEMLLQSTLGIRGYDVWSAYPVHTISTSLGQISMAVLGLLGKMTGACAIIASSLTEEANKRLKVQVHLKALGVLGIWVKDLASNTKVDDLMVMMKGQPTPPHVVTVDEETRVLQIDTEAAWKELDLDAGWNNEVVVDVYFS